MRSALTTSLVVLFVAVPVCSTFAAPAKKPTSEYNELLEAARQCLQTDSWTAFQQDLDARTATAFQEKGSTISTKRLSDLFYFHNVARTFSQVTDNDEKDMLSWLLEHREICGRFLHALDEHDDLHAAVRILKQLRDENEALFIKNRELCIAYSVVWDRYQRYGWFKTPTVEPDTMMKTYRYFNRYAAQMHIPPSKLPWELAIYVADLSVTTEERLYALKNFQKQRNIGKVFFKVPYTRRLSPAHGHGRDIPYTLKNIHDLGGVCMEQAYFATQVGKCLGVPSIYCRGMGRSGLGHAWVSFLKTDRRPIQWDLHSGRYGAGHYWKGLTNDPTNWENRDRVPLSTVQMSAAILTAGSPTRLEESHTLRDAADWAAGNLPDDKAPGDVALALLQRSFDICPYNKESWLTLARLAEANKLTDKQTAQSVDLLFKYTLKSFPDFTLMCLMRFMGQLTDNERKAVILARAFKKFTNRPDLASEIKVAEGDLLLAQGKVKKAVVAYCWPLASFPGEGHVTGIVQERIDRIAEKVTDKEELAGIYRSLINSIARNSGNSSEGLTDIFATLSEKLVALYRELGEDKKAVSLARYAQKYLASRPRDTSRTP